MEQSPKKVTDGKHMKERTIEVGRIRPCQYAFLELKRKKAYRYVISKIEEKQKGLFLRKLAAVLKFDDCFFGGV